VRSSATAEDLPDLSFAGQQDTYLNVLGEEQLLSAVVNCWSSLWTARAIGYRLRNAIDQREAALAVVIQAMIASEVSGVLFSANPLTGLLSETVIDATYGLGEALVAGQVEPDHYVVDTRAGRIVSRRLGAKRKSTRPRPGGGVVSVEEGAAGEQCLADEDILRLAKIGQEIQAEFGAPLDIEWALADGKLYILQSRPITSLFPVPEISFDPLIVWFSFAAVQGLVGPSTPLGIDGIIHFAAGVYRLFGVRVEPENVCLWVPAGERMWVKISDLIRHPLGNRIFRGALNYIEPGTGQIIQTLAAEPALGAGQGKIRLSTIRRILRFFLPRVPALIRSIVHPEGARARFDADIDAFLARAVIPPAGDRFARLANVIAYMRWFTVHTFQAILPRFIPIFAPCFLSLNILRKFSGDDPTLPLKVIRALPNNVTTAMDLALWRAAVAIRDDPAAAQVFSASSAEELSRRYLDGTLPPAAQSTIAEFMRNYGMRGTGEIDFGQPRWREDPLPVMHTIKSYLEIDPQAAPDAVFARGEQSAREAVETLAENARRQPLGALKERQVRAAARRLRILMGARESPKFLAVRIIGIAREAMLVAGREFAEAGTIQRPEDLFFLKMTELDALARGEERDWRGLVAARRAAYEREQRRRQVPRVLVSDGQAFYEGYGISGDRENVIVGSPVSPGVVEGSVRVVLDPGKTRLLPGEILVCPGTDPAWTPLFMAAGGLITEVGGMMTHGSVVAREYGIPAVVGVDRATQRLQDGQRIRLDGSQGIITLLDQRPS
jgi:pyruvate,water dikinase